MPTKRDGISPERALRAFPTGKTVRKQDADIPDPGMLAFFDLVNQLRGHRATVRKIAEELGVDIGGGAHG